MVLGKRPLARDFVAPLLIILPAAYLVWYSFAGVFAFPAAVLSGVLSQLLFSDVVQRVAMDGLSLTVIVNERGVDMGTLVARNGVRVDAGLAFQVYLPPLGSGVPLFVSLCLASDAGVFRHLTRVTLGILMLGLGQTLSVLLKVGATLFSYFPPVTASDALCPTDCLWQMLYVPQYFTYVLLPNLLPVVLWAILYRSYVGAMVYGTTGRTGSEAES